MRVWFKVLGLIMVVAGTTALADTHNWVGGSGNWNTPANWSPAQVPAVGDDVIIDVPTVVTVTLDVDADINNLTLGFTTGPTVNQTLQIISRTLNISGTMTVENSGILTMTGGVLGGTGAVNVNGQFNFGGGSMRDAGTTTIAVGGAMNVSGGSVKDTRDGRTLINNGNLNVGGTGAWQILNTVSITNNDQFLFSGDVLIDLFSGNTATFTNNMTLAKTSGTGAAVIELPFTNTGTVSVTSGTLSFDGGGSGGGTFSAGSGAVLDFGGGTMDLSTAPVSGTGTVSFTGGSTILGTTFNVTNANITGGTADFTTPTPLGTPPADPTIAILALGVGGTLTGDRTVNVTQAMNWTGGGMAGSGQTVVMASANLNISGNSVKSLFDTRLLLTQGDTDFDGAADVDFNDASNWSNDGDMVFLGTGNLDRVSSATSVFTNTGVLIVNITPLVGTNINNINVAIDNQASGDIDCQSGSIRLGGGGTVAGTIQGSGTLIFNSGTYDVSAAVAAGNVSVVIASLTINAAGMTVDNDSTFAQSGGALQGMGTLTNNGQFNWTGGTWTGPGTVAIGGSGTLNLSGSTSKNMLMGWSLNNAGSVNVAGTGTWNFSEGATITNQSGAIFDFVEDTDLNDNSSATAPQFINGGTLRKSAGTGTSLVELQLSNNSVIDGNSGELSFTLGGASTGSITANSGAIVDFGAGTFIMNGSFGGTGTIMVSGASVSVRSSYSPDITTVTNGVLSFDTPSLGLLGLPNTGTLNLSGGDLGGDLTFEVANTFNWSGGEMLGTGITRVNSGGALNISGNSTKVLNGRTFRLSGNGVWSGLGQVSLSNGAVFLIDSGSVFELQTDTNLDEGTGAASSLVINGTLRKATTPLTAGETLGSASSNLEPDITNNGTIELLAGEFVALGDGTYTGAVNVAAGTVFEMNGGTHTWSGTAAGAGTIQVHNADMTIPAMTTVSIPAGTTFQQLAGDVNGDGTLSISGTYDWSGGTMSGAGSVVLNSGAVMSINGASSKTVSDGRALNSSGTITWTGTGPVNLSNGGNIINQPAGVFDIQNDATLNLSGSGAAPFINNGGTFQKTVAAGTTFIEPQFNNNSLLDVQTGTVVLSGGGTSSGSYTASSGAVIQVTNGSHVLDSDSSITGAGTFRLSSVGSVTTAGTFSPTTLDLDAGTLTVNNNGSVVSLDMAGGTLGGTGVITASGASSWTGGEMTGSGGLSIPSLGTLAVDGNTSKRLYDGRTLNNAGTITWMGLGEIGLNNGAVFTNQVGGVFDIQNDVTFDEDAATPEPAFVNAGTVQKTVATGSTPFDVMITNTGLFDVQTGTLDLRGGGTNSATFQVGSGAVLDCSLETFVHDSASTLSGAGTVLTSGGQWDVQGVFTAENIQITGGTMNLDTTSGSSTNTFTQSAGTFGGGSNLTVVNSLTWNGGLQNGTASTIIASTCTGVLGSNVTKTMEDSRILDNNGTLNWQSTGGITLGDNTRIENRAGATFDIQEDASVNEQCCDAIAVSFNNAGVVVKSADTGTTTFNVPMTNSGVLQVQSGEIRFNDPLTGSGDVTLTSPGVLRLAAGTHTFGAGADFTGTGTLLISGATVTIDGPFAPDNLTMTSGSLALNGVSPSVTNLDMSFGTLTGDLAITGAGHWDGGTWDGPGTTTLNAGATLEIDTGVTKIMDNGRIFENLGNVTWLGLGGWRVTNGSVINNRMGGSVDCQSDTILDYISGLDGVFNNEGFFTKSAGGAGQTTVDVVFNNSGTLRAGAGDLRFTRGMTNDNAVEVASPATMSLQNGTYDLNSIGTVSGSGMLVVGLSGIVNQNGGFALDGVLQIESNGQLTANADLTTHTLNVNNGTLGGSAVVTVGNTFSWLDGLMNGSGSTILAVGSTGSISGANAKDLDNTRTFTNFGTLIWQDSGFFRMGETAVFNNEGTFAAQSSGRLEDICCTASPTFNNNGTFRRDASLSLGATSATIDVAFNNTGSVLVNAGSLDFTQPLNQNAGLFRLDGGAASATSAFQLNGGVFDGVGTFTGNVDNNAGVIQGGTTTPGVLTIDGAYNQGSTGIMTAQINGTTVGTDYSRIAVTGAVVLAGTFQAQVDSKFVPTQGDTFEVLQFLGADGEFDLYQGTVLPGGLELTPTFETSRFFLETAPQTVISWANPTSGLWSDGANWVGGVAPGPTDHAHITVDGNYQVILDQNVSVLSVTLGNTGSGSQTLLADDATITTASLSRVLDSGILELSDSSLLVDTGLDGLGGNVAWDVSGQMLVRGAVHVVPAFTLFTGGIVQIQGVNTKGLEAAAVLTADNTFNMDGLVVLESTGNGTADASLTLTSASLNIGANGHLLEAVGTGGDRNVNLTPSGAIINDGKISANNVLLFGGSNGFINNGIMELDNGATLATGFSLQNEGILRGVGTLLGSIDNNGQILPGLPDESKTKRRAAGQLNINGNLNNTSDGRLIFELDGVDAGVTYDRLVVSTNLTLNGAVVAQFPNSFDPEPGTRFDVLTYATLTGSPVFELDNPGNGVRLQEDLGTTVLSLETVMAGPFSGIQAFVVDQSGNVVYALNGADSQLNTFIEVGAHPVKPATNADGSRLYVPNLDGDSLSVIDTTQGRLVTTVTGLFTPVAAAVSPNDAEVWLPGAPAANAEGLGGSHIDVVLTADNTLGTPITDACLTNPTAVVFHPFQTLAYVINADGNLCELDTVTKTVNRSAAIGSSAKDAVITPDGAFLYVTSPGSGVAIKVDTASLTSSNIALGGVPSGLDIDNGDNVYVVRQDPAVSIISTLDDNVTTIIIPGASALEGIAVIPQLDTGFVTDPSGPLIATFALSTGEVTVQEPAALAEGAVPTPVSPLGIASNKPRGDVPPQVFFAAPEFTAVENDTMVTIQAQLNFAPDTEVRVDFSTGTSGTALPGTDYTPVTTTTLVFGPGETSASVDITLADDRVEDGDRTVQLLLANPVGAVLGDPTDIFLTIADFEEGVLEFNTVAVAFAESDLVASIQVTRTGGADGQVTVDVNTADMTAEAGTDYGVTNGQITFDDQDATPFTVTIPLNPDAQDEGNETFSVTLSNPTGNAVLGANNPATVTILDGGTAAFAAASFQESEDAGLVNIQINRVGSTTQAVTVRFSTAPGTAEAGLDYTSVDTSITFEAGQTSGAAQVEILQDTVVDPDEFLNLVLRDPATNNVISNAQLVITDDEQPGFIQFSSPQYDVAENGEAAEITLERVGGSDGELAIVFTTAPGGTADPGDDYEVLTSNVTFVNGQTQASVFVTIVNDTVPEDVETVFLAIGNPGQGLGAQTTAQLNILDDDEAEAVTFQMDVYSVDENAGTALIEVVRTGPAEESRTVLFSTESGGSAEPVADYTPVIGQPLVFAVGQSSVTATVDINFDFLNEGLETVNLALRGVGSSVFLDTAQLEINNINRGFVSFDQAEVTVSELIGQVQVRLNRNNQFEGNLTVQLRSLGGDAQPNLDYQRVQTSVTFADGETSKLVPVTIIDDILQENDEFFGLVIDQDIVATLGETPLTSRINIQDVEAVFSPSSYEVLEGEGPVAVTVVRVGNGNLPMALNLQTGGGAAEAGSDYTALNQDFSLNSSGESQTFNITINNDETVEPSEMFGLKLTFAGETQDASTVTILDDDAEGAVVSFALDEQAVNEAMGAVPFVVMRDGNLASPLTVAITATPAATRPAEENVDYTIQTPSLTFAAGEGALTGTINIIDDALVEFNERFRLSLSITDGPGTLGAPATQDISILDNDEAKVSWVGGTVTAEEGGDSVTLTARSSHRFSTFTVISLNAGGDAVAGTHYQLSSRDLAFNPGSQTATLRVSFPENDEDDEAAGRRLTLTIAERAGSTSVKQINIRDNDEPVDEETPVVNWAQEGSVTTEGGSVRLNAVLNQTSQIQRTVDFSLIPDGTASAEDATPVTGTLTFEPGTLGASVILDIVDDQVVEGTEVLVLGLGGGNLTVGDVSTTQVRIVDNDVAFVNWTQALTIIEEDDTAKRAVAVTLTAQLTQTVGVDVAVPYSVGGNATLGRDHNLESGSLTFPAGTTSASVSFQVLGDLIEEAAESITLTLLDDVIPAGDVPRAVVLIEDNDADQAPDTRIISPSVGQVFKVGQEVTFSAEASDPQGDDVRLFWEICLTTGSCVEREGESFNLSFTDPGRYRVACYAVDASGNEDRTPARTTFEIVVNVPPSIQIIEPATPFLAVAVGETVSFAAEAVDPDEDVGTKAPAVSWYLLSQPDVRFSGTTFETTFNRAGSFTVIAVATDAEGAEATDFVNIRAIEDQQAPTGVAVTEPADRARFNLDQPIDFKAELLSLPATKAALARAKAEKREFAFSWSLGDGRTLSGQTLEGITYERPGRYQVRFVARDAEADLYLEDTISLFIRGSRPPVVDFNFPRDLNIQPAATAKRLESGEVYFKAVVTQSNGFDDSELNFFWDMGDGRTFRQPAPGRLVYRDPGTFTVSLYAVSPDGQQSDTVYRTIRVKTTNDSDFEPNEDFAEAPALRPGSYENLNLDDESSVDFYTVTVTKPGQRLNVKAELDGAATLEVYDTDRNLIQSREVNLQGNVQLQGLDPGTYYLRLVASGQNKRMGLSYSLGISVLNPALFFPDVQVNEQRDTAIGVVNPTNAEASIDATAFDREGNVVGAAQLTLPPLGRCHETVEGLFGEVTDIAWVSVDATGDLVGYSRTESRDFNEMYAVTASKQLSSELHVPHIAEAVNQWETRASVINGSDLASGAQLVSPTRTIDLELERGFSLDNFDFLNRFDGELPMGTAWASFNEVDQNNNLAGVEVFGTIDGTRITAGLELSNIRRNNPNFTYVANNLYFTHVARDVANFYTGIALVNISTFQQTVRLRTYGENGQEIGTKLITMDGNQKLVQVAQDFLDGAGSPENVDWFVIESDAEIIGFELFGTFDGTRLAGLEASTALRTELCYPFIDPDPNVVHGISVVNAHSEAQPVTFTVYKDNGEVLGQVVETLQGNQKRTRTIESLLEEIGAATGTPGWLSITAQSPLAGFELFLNQSDDREQMGAITAQ